MKYSQKTLHSSPERARYGVSFVSSKGNILCRLVKIELYKIFAIINRAIKGLHCISSENIEPQILPISDDVCLQSQTDVEVLGITVDYRLTFNEDIRICTLKAARQLNALSRISKYLDTKSKSVLYHSFIASNFSCCPIFWHFCRVINNNQFEMIQERSLRILFGDYESDVHDLLDSIGGQTLALRRLKFMLLEDY